MTPGGGRYTGFAFRALARGDPVNHLPARDPKVVPTVLNRSALTRAVDPT